MEIQSYEEILNLRKQCMASMHKGSFLFFIFFSGLNSPLLNYWTDANNSWGNLTPNHIVLGSFQIRHQVSGHQRIIY